MPGETEAWVIFSPVNLPLPCGASAVIGLSGRALPERQKEGPEIETGLNWSIYVAEIICKYIMYLIFGYIVKAF